MLPSLPLISTLVCYTLQGIFLGLVDETLPPMSAKASGSLSLSSTLALVKLPLALKFFIAPLVDHAGTSSLTLLLSASQLAGCIPLFLLYGSIDLSFGLNGGAREFNSSDEFGKVIFYLAILGVAIAIADVIVDVYALHAAPRHRALAQVVGIMCGRFLGNTTFVLLHHEVGMNLSDLIWWIGVATFGLFIMTFLSGPIKSTITEDEKSIKLSQIPTQVLRFFTHRGNMFWWILHQLIPPACYFHLEVLRCRFAQVGGSVVTESAAVTDGLVFLPTLLLLIYLDNRMGTTLRSFTKFYVVQVFVSLGLIQLYLSMGQGYIDPSTTGYIYGVFMRIQDTLFFLYEMSEFHFYGEVASLQPLLGATLLALQTSIFNLSEVLHPALAHLLVESSSTDTYDAYPSWGITLTTTGAFFYIAAYSLGAYPAYTTVKDKGWEEAKTAHPSNLWLIGLIGLLGCGVITESLMEL